VLSFTFVVIYHCDSVSALTVNSEFYADFAKCWNGRLRSPAASSQATQTYISMKRPARKSQRSTHCAMTGLHDLVHQPTHSRGHQLDVFITCTNQPAKSVIVDPTLISDHSLIRFTFGANSVETSTQNTLVWRCRRSTFDYDGFVGEFEQSHLVLDIPSDVTDPVKCYDSTTLSTLLDKFAPQRQIRVKARSSFPWFDADCQHCKAATRKLEKAYRKKPCDQSRSAWEKQFSSKQ